MILARIHANGEIHPVYKHNGATAPACIVGFNEVCGYWETRLELFHWACGVIGANMDITTFEDGFTGEILTFEDLLAELEELENKLDCNLIW